MITELVKRLKNFANEYAFADTDTMEVLNDAVDVIEELSAKLQEPILDKIRAEIEKQEKWLLQAGYTAYNVDIAFDAIKAVIAESEG